jgi:hypothetical protein
MTRGLSIQKIIQEKISYISDIDTSFVTGDSPKVYDAKGTLLRIGTTGFVINDGAGAMGEEQYLAVARGGLGINASAITGVMKANGAGVISAATLVNADVDAAAAIETSKLAAYDHAVKGLDKVARMALVTWDQATDGNITASSEFATGVTLPNNAIVIDVIEDMMADSVDNTGTVQLLVGTGGTGITAANTADGTPEVVFSGTGLGTKLAGATQLFIAEGGAKDINSGSLRYFVKYVVSI